jgi:hypothetical protein
VAGACTVMMKAGHVNSRLLPVLMCVNWANRAGRRSSVKSTSAGGHGSGGGILYMVWHNTFAAQACADTTEYLIQVPVTATVG